MFGRVCPLPKAEGQAINGSGFVSSMTFCSNSIWHPLAFVRNPDVRYHQKIVDAGSVYAVSPGPQPPIAFRNESNFVLAGAIDDDTVLRQSPSSPYPLLNPPRAIPDPYGWMRDESRSNQTVLAHLEAENEYTRQMTEHLATLQEELYEEYMASLPEESFSPPTAMGKYWYYERSDEAYPRYCRAPRNLDDLYPPEINADWSESMSNHLLPGEEIYLDVPTLAKNKTYLAVGTIAISPNQEYVAYTLDETGDEVCHFYVRHIATGKEWVLMNENGDAKLRGYGAIEWDEMDSGLFFVTLDETQRPHRVYYRQLFRSDGTFIDDKQSDHLLLEEKDAMFSIMIAKTVDRKYLLMLSASRETSEIHYLDLQSGDIPSVSNLGCIASKREKVLYYATHCKGHWLIQTNVGGLPNLSLKFCRVGDECNWNDVVLKATGAAVFDGRDPKSLENIKVFDPPNDAQSPYAYGVATGREDGLPQVWILEFVKDESFVVSKITRLEFDETAYEVGLGLNRDTSLPYVMVMYDSLVTPLSHIAVPLSNPTDLNARVVIQEVEVPGYDRHLYACERILVKSRDGQVNIPVSLVWDRPALRKRLLMDKGGDIPVHLFGYGSYGASIEASFRIERIPLLNRSVFIH